jgi:glutamate synthase (NADPH/NADH) small chain
MAKITGFLEYPREMPPRRPIIERVNDWLEVYQDFPAGKVQEQAARCMDCGVPFCHTGCPVNNLIPDWNDLAWRGKWKEAIRVLHSTNNFPEFTGRTCPAPCEASCVLGINEPAVTIKLIENSIIERAFEQGYVVPEPPLHRTNKKVAVVGSGPAGLAAAQQLNRAGHFVTVIERADRIGGLLRYGIPDFKLEKWVVDRRLEQLSAEGIEFKIGINVGTDIEASELLAHFDAVLLACGSEQHRDIVIPGRELKGIHFAMDYLTQQNKRGAGDALPSEEDILAEGKHVVIIGGGDTGADCLGTAHRQRPASVRQLQIHPMPPEVRADHTPWPMWPVMLRMEPAHEEGGIREWSALTSHFSGDENGNVKQLHGIRVGPKPGLKPVAGSEFSIDADLVLIAIGFSGPTPNPLFDTLGIELSSSKTIKTDPSYMTSVPGIFSAGDMRRGQSIIVWAISEGRKAAHHIDRFLMGSSNLPA